MSKEDIVRHQWKKGQSGNPDGYSRGRRRVDELEELIREKGADRAVLAKWLQMILEGDFKYFKEYLDRRDGRPIEAKPDDGGQEQIKPRIKIKGAGRSEGDPGRSKTGRRARKGDAPA